MVTRLLRSLAPRASVSVRLRAWVFLCCALLSPGVLGQVLTATTIQTNVSCFGGSNGTASVVASGGVPPYTYSWSPSGGTAATATGLAAGSYAVTVTDTVGISVTRPLTLTQPSALGLGPASLPGGAVSAPYSQTLTFNGGTGSGYSVAVTAGTLPSGLSLTSGGVLSGTPVPGTAGTYNIIVTLTDAASCTLPKAYTLVIATGPIAISPSTLPAATVGSAYSQGITVTGGTAPYTLSITSGSLPAGIAFSSAGVLSGTPTAGGTFSFTATASDSSTPFPQSATSAYALTVNPPTITISPGPLPSALVGVPYSQTLTASGGTAPYTHSAPGLGLPAGLTLSSAGVMSGTPLAAGRYTFSTFVTDSSSGTGPYTGVLQHTLTINTVPIANPVSALVLSGSGANPIALNITGDFADSVAVASAPAHGIAIASGTSITYQPSAGYLGLDSFTYTATNPAGTSAPATVSIMVVAPTITISPPALSFAQILVPFSQTITASGGTGPYSFAITAGALPAGLTLSSTGTLSGTPTAGGTFDFTITATDSSAAPGPFTGSRAYTWNVFVPVTITPATLPPGVVGTPYSQALTANNANPPFEFQLSGSLPPGMTLGFDGLLSGTPTASGSFNFNIIAIENSGFGPRSINQAFTLVVAEQPPVANPVSATVAYGSGANPITLNITGGIPTSVSVGSAPAHGITSASGTSITYQPNAGFAGADSFTYTATNSGGTSAPATVSMTVTAPTIALSPTTLPNPQGGTPYSQTFTASGGIAPYSFAVTGGTLPAGMGLSSAGLLSGTPSAGGSFSFTITATDAGTFTGSQTYTLTVAAPTIMLSPAILPDASGGTPYSQAITASGGNAPYSFAVTAGSLPAGMSFSSAGVLSGTPTVDGVFNFTITATDSSTGTGPFTGSRAYSLTVAAPTITLAPASLPAGVIGTPYSQTITASGGTAPYDFALTAGALPAGMSFSSAGILSGTPIAGGTFNFTITATDANAFTGSHAYTLTVGAATITLSPATLPDALGGTPYSQAITASGGTAPYSFAVTAGALPAGLSLSSTGGLSGTPTAGGSFDFTITATDSSTGTGPFTGSRAYSLTVTAPTITLSPASLPAGAIGTPYSQAVTASGGAAPYSFSLTAGTLPAGMSFSSAGVLSGTPTAGGSFNFTITATDAGAFTGSRAYTLAVATATITLSPATLPDALGGTPYSQDITASGGTAPYSFAVTAGALPAGLNLSNAGLLSGTPTVGGSFNFTITATDSSTGTGPFTGSHAYSLTVTAPTITLSPATLPAALGGTPYSQTITASGGTAPYSFAVTAGALPAGLNLSSAGGLSGTPTAGGTFNFTITATDAIAFTGSHAYTLTVTAPTITISPTALPAGVIGTPYSQAVTASGGTAPYSISISAGTLPPGTVLSSAGNLSGTPTVAGAYNPTISATDALGFSASAAYSIVVSEAVPVAGNDSATVLAGQAVTIPVAANDVGVVSSIAIASAPSVGTATVNGLDVVYTAPAAASGTVTFTYTATGSGGTSAPATVTVTVNPLPVAASRTLTTPAATPVQTELTAGASGGPFTAATIVGVTPAGSGNASIAAVGSGFVLTFTPAADFAGMATVQFTLGNAFATSNVASVQIDVAARADPTQDAEVIGLIDAQAESTRRFAKAQIDNFQRRLERMHGAGADAANGIDNSLGFAMTRSCEDARPGSDDKCRTQDADAVAAAGLPAAPGERVDATAPPISIWIGGTIRSGSQDGRDGSAGLDFETDGISIGADHRVSPTFAFGAGIGYGSDRTDVGAHASRVRGDAWTAALYASYQPGDRFFIDGLLGYQTLSYDLTRTLGGSGGTVVGERDGSQWFGSLSVGADIAHGDLQVTPYGRVDIAQAQLDAYVEHGDPLLALRYDEMDVDTLTGNLGVRLDFRHRTGWGVFAPMFRVEYQYEFDDSGSFGIRYADLLSGPVYRGDATQFDRSRWMLGLGASFATDTDWSFRFEVNGLIGGDGESDTGAMLQAEKRY